MKSAIFKNGLSRIVLPVLLLLGLFLTATPVEAAKRNSLELCIYLYENGSYTEAIDSLKSLIPNAPDRKTQAECYKYLAFSSVMLDMINSAKESFEKMLEQYPAMDVDTVQIPPNITIVFKQVVTEKELNEKKKEESNAGRANHFIGAGVSGALGLAGVGLGIFFYSKENKSYDNYNQSQDPQEIKRFRSDTQNNFLVSRISLGVSAAALLFTGYELWTLPPKKTGQK